MVQSLWGKDELLRTSTFASESHARGYTARTIKREDYISNYRSPNAVQHSATRNSIKPEEIEYSHSQANDYYLMKSRRSPKSPVLAKDTNSPAKERQGYLQEEERASLKILIFN